jgi:hypothetical protein
LAAAAVSLSLLNTIFQVKWDYSVFKIKVVDIASENTIGSFNKDLFKKSDQHCPNCLWRGWFTTSHNFEIGRIEIARVIASFSF